MAATAYTVNDFLTEQSPMIGTDINQKMLAQPSPWINLYKQETWTDEVSNTQKTFQFDRAKLVETGLTDDLVEEGEWANVATDVAFDDNTANHQAVNGDGLPPSDTVEFTQTLRPYNLQHKGVWGPPMNTNQLRDKFVRVKQMGACVKALADQTREFWIERKRSEYTRIADTLVVADSGFALTGGKEGSMAFDAHTGTTPSVLTSGFTDQIYEFLNHQGARDGALGEASGRPVYALVTSPRQSRRLIMQDAATREDFRYSSQNEKLLAPMGVKYNYNGFSHIVDEKCKRWEFHDNGDTGTAALANTGIVTLASVAETPYKGTQLTLNSIDYVVIKRLTATTVQTKRADGTVIVSGSFPVVSAAAFDGWFSIPQHVVTDIGGGIYKRKPNPAWLTATWEDSYIFHQGVCCSLVPKPITSVGQAQFDAVNYSGEYKWTNYDNRENNPDGTIGQFRGVLSNGTRPENPEYGIVIRHLAVPNPGNMFLADPNLSYPMG